MTWRTSASMAWTSERVMTLTSVTRRSTVMRSGDTRRLNAQACQALTLKALKLKAFN